MTTSIAASDIVNHGDIVSDATDQDPPLIGFADFLGSLVGDTDQAYVGDEVVNEELLVSGGEAGKDLPFGDLGGYDLDVGGCSTSAGYSFCENLNRCIRFDETCIALNPLPHCDCAGVDCDKNVCQAGRKNYCGPRSTGDPRVFGPILWKFLHTISMHYNPERNGVNHCEAFIDSFAPMIPCKHCAWHYNQFLYGTQNPTPLDPDEPGWDWGEKKDDDVWDNSPCKSTTNLQSFFVEAHNNVGQHVQLNEKSGETRPTFQVKDLEELYGHIYDPIANKFVRSNNTEVFQPLLLEAINIIAMNHAMEQFVSYKPLEEIKSGCEHFLNNLPFMLGDPWQQQLVNTNVTKTTCESNSTMLDWVEEFEGKVMTNILSLDDRKRRYQKRSICMHNKLWLKFPMHRMKKDPREVVCDGHPPNDKPRSNKDCTQPWHPVLLKNITSR